MKSQYCCPECGKPLDCEHLWSCVLLRCSNSVCPSTAAIDGEEGKTEAEAFARLAHEIGLEETE